MAASDDICHACLGSGWIEADCPDCEETGLDPSRGPNGQCQRCGGQPGTIPVKCPECDGFGRIER